MNLIVSNKDKSNMIYSQWMNLSKIKIALKIKPNLAIDSDGFCSIIRKYVCLKCNKLLSRKDSYLKHLETNKHKMSPEEYKKFKSETGRKAMLDGDDNELYALDLLHTLNLETIINYGYTGNKFDAFIKFDDEQHYRGLQIKTLVKSLGDDNYVIKTARKGYDQNALIMAISQKKDRYALVFYKEMNGKNISISRTYNSDKLIDDVNIFKTQLLINLRNSTIVTDINDFLSDSQRQETESIERFKLKCQEYGLEFKRNTTNSNEIDGSIGDYNIQFKSSKSIKNNTYHFSLFRRTNSKCRPYNIEDNVHFFVFEIIDTKYQNNFYIIPQKALIDGNYITHDDVLGKYGIGIPPLDYNKTHWILAYLNKFDQFNTNLNIKIDTLYSSFHKKCIEKNLECKFSKKNRIISVNSHNVRIMTYYTKGSINCIFDLRIQKNNKRESIHENDNYHFLIFDFGIAYQNQFCIIPVDVLIQHKYISTQTENGSTRISIPYPGSNSQSWMMQYINNFDSLLK